jgi:hypothetical protein
MTPLQAVSLLSRMERSKSGRLNPTAKDAMCPDENRTFEEPVMFFHPAVGRCRVCLYISSRKRRAFIYTELGLETQKPKFI